MGIYRRGKTYWISYTENGRSYRESAKSDNKRAAEDLLHKRKHEIREGIFFPGHNLSSVSFKDMAGTYWDLHAKQKPSAQTTQYHLKMLVDFFGSTPLDKIKVPDILQYLNGVKERSSAATANRHHNILRAIFNRALEWEKFNGTNPAAKVKQFRVENSRTQFLEMADITRLLAACDSEIEPIVSLAILTGMRRGEIVNLRWEHIDMKNGIIHVLKTKSGEPREIPIASNLMPILEARRKGDGGPVFNISTRALNSHFSKALKLAGIAGFRFHDLRHYADPRIMPSYVALP
ncbi:phage integrase family protein [sediment metagenome]|uniref:Phage integrase family protein n=1 Tax=sediment metagenome TaxID=749907 RepID=D9PLF6_9ZZZZ